MLLCLVLPVSLIGKFLSVESVAEQVNTHLTQIICNNKNSVFTGRLLAVDHTTHKLHTYDVMIEPLLMYYKRDNCSIQCQARPWFCPPVQYVSRHHTSVIEF